MFDPLVSQHAHVELRVDPQELAPDRLGFRFPDGVERSEDLTVEVRDLETIDVRDRQVRNPRACERKNTGTAHAADPAYEDARCTEQCLLRFGNEADVPRDELAVVEGVGGSGH